MEGECILKSFYWPSLIRLIPTLVKSTAHEELIKSGHLLECDFPHRGNLSIQSILQSKEKFWLESLLPKILLPTSEIKNFIKNNKKITEEMDEQDD